MLITSAYSSCVHQPKSLLTDEQLEYWFSHPTDGLCITNKDTLAAFKVEVPTPADLLGMSEEDIDSINYTISARTTDSRARALPSFRLTHRSVLRLKKMVNVVNFLSLVRRDIEFNSVRWEAVQVFDNEWVALKTLAGKERGVVPKFKSSVGMPRHVLNMIDYLRATFGSQSCPLYYLVCPAALRDDSTPEDAPGFVEGRHFAPPHTRLSDEIRGRASRTTPNAQADNELLYKILVESFVGTNIASQAEDFERTRDGLGFWERLQATQCTDQHHEKAAHDNINYLRSSKWEGPESGDFTKYLDKARRQFANYTQAREHCQLQEYSDRTRVGWLLAGITSKDTQLCIRMNNVKDDDEYMDDWEKTAIYLAKTDYEGKNSKGKRKARFAEGDVSGVQGNPNGGGGGGGGGGGHKTKKPKGLSDKEFNKMLKLNGGMGETGVELRWHTPAEYAKLTHAQRSELNKWRATQGFPSRRSGKRGNGGNGGGGGAAGASAAEVSALQQSVVQIASILSVLTGGKAQENAQAPGAVGSVTVAPPSAGENAGTPSVAEVSTSNAEQNPTPTTANDPT
eukprot:scaffold382_cov162-Skeletonema_dohrnii-CCMP3373.AAC.1